MRTIMAMVIAIAVLLQAGVATAATYGNCCPDDCKAMSGCALGTSCPDCASTSTVVSHARQLLPAETIIGRSELCSIHLSTPLDDVWRPPD
jgi:hypothetical protein